MSASVKSEILKALSLFYKPGQVFEVRIPNYPVTGSTTSGYFDDHAKAAAAVEEYNGRAPGIYTTLNPVVPALLARCCNRLQQRARQTTCDSDVLRIAWLPIDLDPRRPAGISSTDAEHELAHDRGLETAAWLQRQGFPTPVLASSGNGSHLLYRVDLANDGATRTLIARCLRAVAFQFDDDAVHIDTGVGNASRLWRLYGTVNAKGDATAERPHRTARILTAPDSPALVSVDLLEKLAAWCPEDGPTPQRASGFSRTAHSGEFDLSRWIADRGIAVARSGPWLNGGKKWVLKQCPWNPEHTDRSAFIVQFSHGPIGAGCHHHSCSGRGWHDLRDALEPDWRDRRRPGEPPAGQDGGAGVAGTARAMGCIPDYQPFPVDALPGPLAGFVREGAAALGCDPAMVALPVIAVCGSLVGATRTIRLKHSWREPCVFWTCVIADSGTLKSPAHALATQPLHTLQERLCVEHAARMTRYRDALEQWRARKAAGRGAGGDEPAEPILPRVICGDTTIERLAELLADNPRGLLVARDELAAWLGSFRKYKSQGGTSDLPNWLEMHRAGPVIIDRKSTERKTLVINRASVSIAGTIQPGVLAKNVQGDFLDSGLVARLLLARPPKTKKSWRETDLSPETEAGYEQLLEKLYRLDFERPALGSPRPRSLTLDDGAKGAWIAFYEEWAGEQAGAEGDRAAALSKLEGYAARLALLHHVVGRVACGLDDGVPIGVESVGAGVRLARWFAEEARRVYVTFVETGEQRETRRLVEFIAARGGNVTARELHRSNNRRYPGVAAAELALAGLAAAGLGAWVEAPPGPQGGRPARVFRLHDPGPDNGEGLHDETSAA